MSSFEKIFVINLPFRQDRLKTFYKELEKTYFDPSSITEWPAIHGDTCNPPELWTAGAGAWGCYKSHLNILEYCLNNNISSYLVFEDDAKFKDDFDIGFCKFIEEVPEDWQQLYLGGQLMHENSHRPIKISENVYKPYNVNRTHCFAISNSGMLPIYKHLSNLPFEYQFHIDHHLGRWHEDQKNKVYCPARWLVGQMGSSSNVSGKTEPINFFDDPQELALDHWLYSNPVCVVFRGSYQVLKQASQYFHIGNTLDGNGCDKSLNEASKYMYPGPAIDHWFGWVRGEIVKEGSNRIPCIYHPRLTDDMISKASVGKVYYCHSNSLEDIVSLHSLILNENKK